MLIGVGVLVFVAWYWWQSRLPGSYDVTSYGEIDRGGGEEISHQHVGVDTLSGPKGKPDYDVTLTAEQGRVKLSSGREVDAWTFNGRAPGPELRIQRGELVQVTLVNKDIDEGVTIHWQ